MNRLTLITPTADHLPHYADALQRGWSPSRTRPEIRLQELAQIADAPKAFLANQDRRQAQGDATVSRLVGYSLWLWDGEFCGYIDLRWQPGTTDLPDGVRGHIGYAVVPWKRRLGYATQALALSLPLARQAALDHVELITESGNIASQKVILANGGKPHDASDAGAIRFQIAL